MLDTVFNPRCIKLDLESTSKPGVFGELIETIAESDPKLKREDLLEAVTLRESKMNTMIRPRIAVPHGYLRNIEGIIGSVGFSQTGVRYDNQSGNAVHLFFMLLMGEKSREQHLQVFSRLLEMLNSTAFEEIARTGSPRQLYDLISQF